jgi:hypothetical protein
MALIALHCGLPGTAVWGQGPRLVRQALPPAHDPHHAALVNLPMAFPPPWCGAAPPLRHNNSQGLQELCELGGVLPGLCEARASRHRPPLRRPLLGAPAHRRAGGGGAAHRGQPNGARAPQRPGATLGGCAPPGAQPPHGSRCQSPSPAYPIVGCPTSPCTTRLKQLAIGYRLKGRVAPGAAAGGSPQQKCAHNCARCGQEGLFGGCKKCCW